MRMRLPRITPLSKWTRAALITAIVVEGGNAVINITDGRAWWAAWWALVTVALLVVLLGARTPTTTHERTPGEH